MENTTRVEMVYSAHDFSEEVFDGVSAESDPLAGDTQQIVLQIFHLADDITIFAFFSKQYFLESDDPLACPSAQVFDLFKGRNAYSLASAQKPFQCDASRASDQALEYSSY